MYQAVIAITDLEIGSVAILTGYIGDDLNSLRGWNMVEITAGLIDVFAETLFGGNPLAVVEDADGLSDAQMRRIAGEFNQAETTFAEALGLEPDDVEPFPAARAADTGAAHLMVRLRDVEAVDSAAPSEDGAAELAAGSPDARPGIVRDRCSRIARNTHALVRRAVALLSLLRCRRGRPYFMYSDGEKLPLSTL